MTQVYYDIISSPIGDLIISSDDEGMTGLHIEGDRYFRSVPDDWRRESNNVLLNQAIGQLDEYFQGRRQVFELPLNPGGTYFQNMVWKALEEIPYGSTLNYTQLAEAINLPHAVRAVASAVGRNPICILVPCHRVVGKNGALSGYVAGLDKKEWLLNLENNK